MTTKGGEPVIKVVDFGVSTLLAGGMDGTPPDSQPPASDKKDHDSVGLETTLSEPGQPPKVTPPDKEALLQTARGIVTEARTDKLTQTGVIMGTPLYMAPELLRGAKLARPASDIFSFGVIAYELLTGRLPSENPPMLLPLKPLVRWYTPLAVRCPGLHARISGIVERCLDATPQNRPTAAELAALLRKHT